MYKIAKLLQRMMLVIFFVSTGLGAAAVDNSEPTSLPAENKSGTLFTDIKYFDGKTNKLRQADVYIENNIIVKIAKKIPIGESVTVITGKGHTLIPGMHDMHVHFALYPPILTSRQNNSPMLSGAVGILRAENILMNGFTTVRGGGGTSRDIKLIVDAGLQPGPRILPSEAWISPTGGHADFRGHNDPHAKLTGISSYNWHESQLTHVVDGVPQIMSAVRENFRRGATQIKLMVSGGVATPTDPLHTVQFTPSEIRAAVEVADLWGSYVFAHVLNERSLLMAVENGIKAVEHIPMLTDETARLIIDRDIMVGTSTVAVLGWSEEQARETYPGPLFEKWKTIRDQAISMLKTMKRNPEVLEQVTFSSDLVGPWKTAYQRDQSALKEFSILAEYFSPFEILRIFTSNGAKYNSLTGPNHPYKEGSLGVIEEGAYADVLLVRGNPLKDIELLADPGNNLLIIMKDGKIYKNAL